MNLDPWNQENENPEQSASNIVNADISFIIEKSAERILNSGNLTVALEQNSLRSNLNPNYEIN